MFKCVSRRGIRKLSASHRPAGPKGARRYRYYVCTGAQKRGWHTCPSKSIPAQEIERLVLEQIKCIGRDEELQRATFAAATEQTKERLQQLEIDRRQEQKVIARLSKRKPIGTEDSLPQVQEIERRLTSLNEEIIAAERNLLSQDEVARALCRFDSLWDALTPHEQSRIIQLIVERVDYDGGSGKVAINFHRTGIRTLAQELSEQPKEQSA